MPRNIKFNILDAYVTSVVCYGSEIWGFTATDVIECVRHTFIKHVLNVKLSASKYGMYGETGRHTSTMEQRMQNY